MRGSRDYRLRLAETFLLKFYYETAEARTSAPTARRGRIRPCSGQLQHGRCRAVGRSTPHESARAHVTGRAVYLDDLPPFRNELLVEFVGSPLAHARIVALDVTAAAQVEGIAAVFTAADVPGDNHFRPDLSR